MHKQVLEFGRKYLAAVDICSKQVIDVGSLNINGSLKADILKLQPAEYIGIDFRAGKDVDVVCNAKDIVARFGKESFDVVICTEMLEHADDWQTVISNLKNICKPGGIILLTARSVGFHVHGYPEDYWRFDCDDMKVMFSDCAIVALEVDSPNPGVLLKAIKPPLNFNEADLSGYEVFSVHKNYKKQQSASLRPAIKYVKDNLRGNNLIGAEIGVAGGNNAMSMVKELKLKELHLIDIWEKYQVRDRIEDRYFYLYDKVVQKFAPYSFVQIHKKESIQAAMGFPEQYFDFVYIDACHDTEPVKQDIRCWLPKVKKGGLLGGHDYSSGWKEVVAGVDWWVTQLHDDGIQFEFIREYPDWIIVL